MRQPTRFLPLTLAAAALACGGALAQEAAEPVWTQAALEELARSIQADIEELRGETFRHPVAVKLADRATLIDYMKRRTEQTEPPEKIAADETVAKLLGLIPADMDLMATAFELIEEQVGGFYDPSDKTFYLMDSMPKGLGPTILAHELVHALDDQLYDLDGTINALAGDSDESLAYSCVVEGSGTAGMTRWTMEHMGEVDLSGYQEMMEEQQASLGRAPDWLWRPLLAAYLQGAAFLARSDNLLTGQARPATSADIDHAFRNRPRSTEQVLHPEKYWDDELRDDPTEVALDVDADGLPRGWSERRQDTLGEFGLALLATPPDQRGTTDFTNPMSILGVENTNAAASGWDGDRLILLGGDGAVWLRLASVWDSERDAGEFFGVLSAILPSIDAAAKALGEHLEVLDAGGRAGAELVYGAEGEVVLTVWAGPSRRDLRRLDEAVRVRVGAQRGN